MWFDSTGLVAPSPYLAIPCRVCHTVSRLRPSPSGAISSEDCAAWETQSVPRQSHGTMQNAARYALQDVRCALSKMERRSHEGVAHDAREAYSRGKEGERERGERGKGPVARPSPSGEGRRGKGGRRKREGRRGEEEEGKGGERTGRERRGEDGARRVQTSKERRPQVVLQ